jgi:magnesium and cobalt transporter
MSSQSNNPSNINPNHVRQRSWINKMVQRLSMSEPQSQAELLDVIKEAAKNQVVDQAAVEIIEGAFEVANLQAREIMIPRSQMVVINANEKPSEFLPKIIESGHSRFPVIGESVDEIKGILLAKDLLPLILEHHEDFELKDILRAANIIPESKRLNILLKEFREKRYHMAIVIDEYGGTSGLVTIEDILEEIVGDIGDETDEEEEAFIRQVSDTDYIIKALTPIEDINEHFKSNFSDDEFDTIGGHRSPAHRCDGARRRRAAAPGKTRDRDMRPAMASRRCCPT